MIFYEVKNMSKTGERIREARLAHGLTIKQLAKLTGITEKSISRYENGQFVPDSNNIIQLACIFDISADYLLGLSDDANVTLSEEYRSQSIDYRRIMGNSIQPNTIYYVIEFAPEYEDIPIRGLMNWCGQNESGELYCLRPIEPEIYISLLLSIGRKKPLIINCLDDYYVFLTYGGNALISEELCKKCVPYLLRPGTVKFKDYIPEGI